MRRSRGQACALGTAAAALCLLGKSSPAFSLPQTALFAQGKASSWVGRKSAKPAQRSGPRRSFGDVPLQRGPASAGKGFAGKGFLLSSLLAVLPGFARRQAARLGRGKTAAAAEEKEAAPESAPWAGAKPKEMAICVALGLFIRFILPVPAALTGQAWSMLAIFVSTIAGIVLGPLPPPGVALCGLTVAVLSGTLTFAQGMAAFTDEVIWLVVLAFFFARGFAKTGLGDRIAFNVVRAVGNTTLGLAYGLNAAEAVVAAGMPSSAARAAGIFYPVAVSVAKASGSDPATGTEKKTGSFLIQSAFQATGNSASLFLTGAAQNMLVLRLAAQLGYELPSPFKSWLMATCVPALVAMAVTPLLAYYAVPPEVKKTPEAPEAAKKKLEEMGPMGRDEIVMAVTVVGMVTLWAGASSFGIPPVVTALLGLCTLIVFGTVTWGDCVNVKGAWSTFTWFSILVGMSAMLNKMGIVSWLASIISSQVTGLGLSAAPAFVLLLILYNSAHYMFASQVAHVGALFQPFVMMMVQTGTPPMVAVMSLAVASNLFASLTPYASAQAPVFYGGGYVSQAVWYRTGLIFLVVNLLIWGVVGGVWWKVLGMY